MDFWQWLQLVMGGPPARKSSAGEVASSSPGPLPQDTPVVQPRRNWSERISTDMARSAPMPLEGSLKNAIWAVLGGASQNWTNEIHPQLAGGAQNPFILDELTVVAPEFPDLATQQRALDSLGVLPGQRGPDWSEERARRIYNATSAFGAGYYGDPSKLRQEAIEKLRRSRSDRPREVREDLAASEDAWAMYLGLPQQFRSWEVSPYRPSEGKEISTVYLRSPAIWEDLLTGELQPAEWNPSRGSKPTYPEADGTVRRLLEFIGPESRRVVSGGALMDHEGHGPNGERLTSTVPFALADFTISVGADERGPYISLYDIWDLDRIPGADTVGKPFEVYDRLYFDPATLQPIWDRHR